MKAHSKLQVLVIYCYLSFYSTTGDAVYPPFEFRRDPREIGANKLSLPNSNFPSYHVPQQQLTHTAAMQSLPVPTAEKSEAENSRYYTFNRFLNEMNRYSGVNEEGYPETRAATSASDVNKFFTRQNLDAWTPSIHESTSLYAPSIQHQSTGKATPKFNLFDPDTTKMSSKMSGLMGLIFALLGSGSDNLLMKGFKDVLIDDIIKPLLVAKGGIKMLISKLAIPVVALILINVEVLITVWWLWDDCPKLEKLQPQPAPYRPAYPQPVTDNYSYNSTY